MNKRVEIMVEKSATPEQKDEQHFERARVDLNGLCKSHNLHWLSYKECFACRQTDTNCSCKKENKDIRVVYFIHERGETTGLKFLRKLDMAEAVVNFVAAQRMRDVSLVIWGGRQGFRVLTTMSAEKRAEIKAHKAALEAMKEASAAGEMVNVEAGVAPLTEMPL